MTTHLFATNSFAIVFIKCFFSPKTIKSSPGPMALEEMELLLPLIDAEEEEEEENAAERYEVKRIATQFFSFFPLQSASQN